MTRSETYRFCIDDIEMGDFCQEEKEMVPKRNKCGLFHPLHFQIISEEVKNTKLAESKRLNHAQLVA